MINKIRASLLNISASNKLFIVSIILIILFIGLRIYNSVNVESKLINYLDKRGYVNKDGGNYYYKDLLGISLDEYNYEVSSGNDSHYEVNYFDVEDIILKKNKRDYEDSTSFLLNESYDYKTREVKYSYRVQYSDQATFIFSGNYMFSDGEFKFTCEKDYIFNFDVSDKDQVICNKVKSDVSDFYKEAMSVIDNYSLINRLIK